MRLAASAVSVHNVGREHVSDEAIRGAKAREISGCLGTCECMCQWDRTKKGGKGFHLLMGEVGRSIYEGRERMRDLDFLHQRISRWFPSISFFRVS